MAARRIVSGFRQTTWTTAAVDLGALLAALLPLSLLLKRSLYAVQLVGLYAGLKAAAHFIVSFSPVFGGLFETSDIVRSVLTNMAMCALWCGLLLYFERSEDTARLFPREERRRTWWPVVPMAALILVYM